MNIGPSLKQIRLEKEYTLSEVAARLSMSVSLLSQIENGKITPSLQSLEELLRFYATNFADFFSQVEQRKYIIVRAHETRSFSDETGKVKLTLLASKLQNNALESYLVELDGNAFAETAVLAREINGERMLYIINGSISVLIDSAETCILAAGDSLNYKSYVSCRIQNSGESSSRFVIAGLPPIFM